MSLVTEQGVKLLFFLFNRKFNPSSKRAAANHLLTWVAAELNNGCLAFQMPLCAFVMSVFTGNAAEGDWEVRARVSSKLVSALGARSHARSAWFNKGIAGSCPTAVVLVSV